MQNYEQAYETELSEIQQENMKFKVIHRRPASMDMNQKKDIERELYKIFEKYE